MLIYLMLMAEAFFGYLLPWGQMSYWGAQVIVNLFDALPLIGPDLALWIRGDYVVSDATLNRFFSFHVIAIPLVLLGLVAAHIMALHEVGSNNPDGIEIKQNLGPDGHPVDGIPFHPYYTVKDTLGVMVFLAFFAIIMFFMPEFGGYFLEYNNFIPADPLKTPSHIAPVWYFTPYYSILRATTAEFMYVLALGLVLYVFLIWRTARTATPKVASFVVGLILLVAFFAIDAKVWGVVFMGLAVMIFFLLPWLDVSPVKSIRYKGGLYKGALAVFVVAFLVLGYYGTQPVTDLGTRLSQFFTLLYFAFFLLMPWFSRMDATRPPPARLTH
jgi:ubiquinol-cytochrome c reductase cytochrome b subunit